jgi:hypothetical protein
MGLVDLAGDKVDVMVIQCGACEHCTVGVESRAGDGRRAVVVKEARVGLERGEIGSVDIVSLDLVAVCSPGDIS